MTLNKQRRNVNRKVCRRLSRFVEIGVAE